MPTRLNGRVTLSLGVSLIMLLLAACGGQAAAPAGGTGDEAYDPSVLPLSAEEAVAYLEIAGPADVLPCGVFNVQGHGEKIVTLADFSNCTPHPELQVACLNANAEWTSEFVQNVGLSADTESVHFTSNQEGICAIFPPAE